MEQRAYFQRSVLLIIWTTIVCFCLSVEAFGSEISLNLRLEKSRGGVVAWVLNRGADPVQGMYLSIEFEGQRYGSCLSATLQPEEKRSVSFSLPRVRWPGSYPVLVRASYLNEGSRLGVLHADTLSFGKRPYEGDHLSVVCNQPKITFRKTLQVSVPKPSLPSDVVARVALPSHIQARRISDGSDGAKYFLKNSAAPFRTASSAFVFYESVTHGVHRTSICPFEVVTLPPVRTFGLFSIRVLLILGLSLFFASCYWYMSTATPSAELVARIRWAFTAAISSFLYAAFRSAGVLPDLVAGNVNRWEQWGVISPFTARSFRVLLERLYFVGNDFDRFFLYLADPLYLYLLTVNYFVLVLLIRPLPHTDKYWNFLVRCFLSPLFRPLLWLAERGHGRKREDMQYSLSLSNVAVLAYFVKIFYLPMLWSWTCQNMVHLHALSQSSQWDYFSVCRALIDAMIFVDVFIFTVGYAIEIPFLRNVIRSVEPTLFGWTVCLVCYPPFNHAFFPLFDFPVSKQWPVFGEATRGVALFLVAILWFVYMWATVALGMKSSNLTNRGIVSRGPYRFVRHPAYASKVSVWILSALFLGEGFGLNVFVAACIYTLRAVTEEWHLERDGEYIEYRKNVRWMFIPRVI